MDILGNIGYIIMLNMKIVIIRQENIMKFVVGAVIIALTMSTGAGLSWAENQAPVVNGIIPGYSMKLGDLPATVDLGLYFSDPDGDALSYTAESHDAGVVTASVSGDTVELTPVAQGPATVVVTARDPGGLSVTDFFKAHVSPPISAVGPTP